MIRMRTMKMKRMTRMTRMVRMVFSLAAVALHKASFSADDGVRNEWRETVTAPFSFFNCASMAFAGVPSQVQHNK